MPFITEEIWHQLQARTQQACIMVASWPTPVAYEQQLLEEANLAFTFISELRNIRASANISPKQTLEVYTNKSLPTWISRFNYFIQKLSNITPMEVVQQPLPGSVSCNIQDHTFYIAVQQAVDPAREVARLQKDLVYYQGFLSTITKKLDNPQFVAQAPAAVIDMERKKQADAVAKVQVIEARLKELA
jgi:valyl-tRNA synthetase